MEAPGLPHQRSLFQSKDRNLHLLRAFPKPIQQAHYLLPLVLVVACATFKRESSLGATHTFISPTFAEFRERRLFQRLPFIAAKALICNIRFLRSLNDEETNQMLWNLRR